MTVAHYTCWSKSSTISDLRLSLDSPGSEIFDRKDNSGRTILHLAAYRGNIDLVRDLLENYKWSEGPIIRDNAAMTPLHYATQSSRTEIIDILIDHGFDLRAVDFKGWLPLHYAASAGTMIALKYVVKRMGSEYLMSGDNDGKTPACLARESGNVDAIKYLTTLPIVAGSRVKSCERTSSLVMKSTVMVGATDSALKSWFPTILHLLLWVLLFNIQYLFCSA